MVSDASSPRGASAGTSATAGLPRRARSQHKKPSPHGRTGWPWHTLLCFMVAMLLCGGAAVLAAEEPAAAKPEDKPAAAAPAEKPAADAKDEEAAPQVLSPELRGILDKLDEANKKLTDCTASVTYERSIPLLDEKQKSRGDLTFKKPNKIVLKLGEPRNEDVYTDGKTWWVVENNDKQVEIYQAAQPGQDQGSQETAFLDFGYGRGSKAFLKDYTVELVSKETKPLDDGKKETLYRLKFTPRPKKKDQPPSRYASIEVVISDQLWLPQVLVLHESGGDIDHTYTLSKIKLNTGVKDDVFAYKPPHGYTVLHPQSF